ncbi:hypothetical protein DICSQDRAFT_55076 [Dichomitus squalens LYAD-421 SS1]|uniref:Ser-Thr-rich glycosyl-phosphatidyl-inositol-anchored membrane family-domain-containing protein n=1 Tax=Dichomitus squalens TaxID=114155 RepID=A0A4Q9Q2D3_9APHY|nr:uncharacterized protein DICSQDRAFT_55076 [Dichomitus squalens LYAD-421 SS1]EJF63833.1 hypothetical protein DICSQDRAFT_55076 [Dichomitus squalens LYAD-421 SS1]TBU31358.1 hypothetical protein BD311DRAFT_716547 [Dichomitus squalens]TBU61121.1 hypothetical protein BD310DRAFT_813889 [Dichomitus squalens]
MKFSAPAFSATLFALASGVTAQLTILSPGGPDLWWVAQSDNDITWTCKTSPYTNFTVLIANSDPTVLVQPQAFIAQQNNFDCSELITKDRVNMPPATGYTIQLADPFNETNVYATSQPFEIKPLGSVYPASSATPTATGSATGSASGSATETKAGAAAASSSASGSNGAAGLVAPGSLAAAAIAALGLMFA